MSHLVVVIKMDQHECVEEEMTESEFSLSYRDAKLESAKTLK